MRYKQFTHYIVVQSNNTTRKERYRHYIMNDKNFIAEISGKILITGAAGFLGTNLALRLLDSGGQPLLVDNLSRRGSEKNFARLKQANCNRFITGDLAHPETAKQILENEPAIKIIIHLAGQTAVTVSMDDPMRDFNDNVLASVNLMKAAATLKTDPLFVFSSSNKVYGPLTEFEFVEEKTRYSCPTLPGGVAENRKMVLTDSIYSLSKGTVEMMLSVYGKQTGLRSTILRQSCIYGPHQCGYADQGWVFWFIHCMFNQLPITIYGDGKQVRDILYVDDYVDLLLTIISQQDKAANLTFNIGGGRERSTSLIELLDLLSDELSIAPRLNFEEPRVGDQKVFISDISSATDTLGWQPKYSIESGIQQTIEWLRRSFNSAPQ
jgi:CDP-paratose 2-epimerase